jgi:NAD(P)-dependent dehydrogenase (short-subunit alcohol dehydrogenase family)
MIKRAATSRPPQNTRQNGVRIAGGLWLKAADEGVAIEKCCRTEISFLIPVNRLLIGAIFDQMTQEHTDFMLSKTPCGRFVTVEVIASLAAFCASSDCSFTTGAVFDISGGRH